MLQSLERRLGLPIAFDPTAGAIHLTAGILLERSSQRTSEEMAPYVGEPGARASSSVIYSMYRNVRRENDDAAIADAKLRYDITILLPGFFAGERKEFFRTAGHYHPVKPGAALAYPEVYEVISGRAHWLLQRPHSDDASRIEEIYAVEAGPGEKAVMIPGFGHMLVNVGSEPLITINWIGLFAYDYEPYRRLRGSGYWMLEGAEQSSLEFLKNPNYASVPELKKLQPRELPEFGLFRDTPGYSLAHDLTKLDFLLNPEHYAELLTVEHCYRLIP